MKLKIIISMIIIFQFSCTTGLLNIPQSNNQPQKRTIVYVYFEVQTYGSDEDFVYNKELNLHYEHFLLGKSTEDKIQQKIPYKNGIIFFCSGVKCDSLRLSKLILRNYSGLVIVTLGDIPYFDIEINNKQLYSLGAHNILFKIENVPTIKRGPHKFFYSISKKYSISEIEILEQIKKNINDSFLIGQIENRISYLRINKPILKFDISEKNILNTN